MGSCSCFLFTTVQPPPLEMAHLRVTAYMLTHMRLPINIIIIYVKILYNMMAVTCSLGPNVQSVRIAGTERT